jgi:hypothetical protein
MSSSGPLTGPSALPWPRAVKYWRLRADYENGEFLTRLDPLAMTSLMAVASGPRGNHSCRSASIGRTRSARRAGPAVASSPAAITSAATMGTIT